MLASVLASSLIKALRICLEKECRDVGTDLPSVTVSLASSEGIRPGAGYRKVMLLSVHGRNSLTKQVLFTKDCCGCLLGSCAWHLADQGHRESSCYAECMQSAWKQASQQDLSCLDKIRYAGASQVYMASGLIKGTESYCCEECMDSVVAGGVKVTFHSWESPNGTNESRGQVNEY